MPRAGPARPGAPRMSAPPAPRPQMGVQPGPQPMMMARPGMAPVPMAQQVRPQQTFKYTPTARNPPTQVMPGQVVAPAPQAQQAVLIQGQEPLTSCMLLEINNAELLHMWEDHNSLKSKVEEAVAVL